MNKYYYATSDPFSGQGVGGHELGHALGLGHTNYWVLMNPGREIYNDVWTPQPDDIKGVNNLY
nr:matrixin family metalloprotease [Paenactinomyces guangxiensis]